ncbi:MAG: hypothetical protein EOM11_08530 [Erysipelotrichia bacterium]|nr:hypothetical protein [Erysipelotrichia bacterium]
MMLKKDSLVKIEMNKDMSPHLYSSLNLLYLPLMGEQAYLFYTTLMAIKLNDLQIKNHILIQKISGLSSGAIEKARKKCEEFLLLRTYYNEREDAYLYVLDVPMKVTKFLGHEVFGRLLLDSMGADVISFYRSQMVKKRISRTAYKEISATMQDTLKNNWDYQKEKSFQDVKEEMDMINYGFLNVIFDEKVFLNGLSDMLFPLKERTKKNLRTISEIATIYGINEVMMKALIAKGIDLPQQKFNAQKLKNVCMKSKAKYASQTSDPYQLPPRRYLEYKQNGVPLGNADIKLIEKLMGEYRLQPIVVNVLLETGLLKDKDNPRIIASDIERMAGSWLRLKIDTFEKAKEQQQKELQSISKRVNKTQQAIVQEWHYDEEPEMSEEEKQQLIEKIKNRGDA